jgi:hypothetical protein
MLTPLENVAVNGSSFTMAPAAAGNARSPAACGLAVVSVAAADCSSPRCEASNLTSGKTTSNPAATQIAKVVAQPVCERLVPNELSRPSRSRQNALNSTRLP